ncbi:Na+ driven multidrug efflux pump, MATE efflux family [Gottschalkia acidurici 9a]|uniref:Multidrug export protein MepA n=1 Tax=Gottschalkia acidurici (strain ATCC 7906 / DSM 604 / BCRC 14475 / CIP 104303 / KCTC 5404 / NCIMB 10678 / 9a) TaxID=1128398 RepID=K0AWQ7_GOTA9|nr:MATE family efflux transporter [Gottschalkia acidurici]AFS77165.1 Na+ driven multidrug efflux pump, MATE efflux family [Gottschalkia acidurici 9a]
MSNKVDLLNDDVRKTFFRYLIPSIGGMLGTSLYVLADTMFVGRGIGSQGLAALNISIPMMNVFNGLGLLFGIGGATALSISRGQNDEDQVNHIFTKAMLMAGLLGIIFTIVRIFFLDELCTFLGASGTTLQMAKDYLGAVMSFSIAFLLNSALTVFVRNDGAPKLAMWGMLSGSIANVILDYVFIFIFGWGMWGAAVATGMSPVISLVILSTHFIRKNNTIKIIKTKLQLNILKRIVANGGSSFIVEISSGIVIFAFNNVILDITGDIGVSAYSIIANLSLVCTAIFTGIGQAIQPIVSINYGARKIERVYESARMAIYWALGLGVVFYMIGILFPNALISIFNKDNAELADITSRGIRLYFIAFIFMGLNIVMASYIQSTEQARTSMIISLSRGFIFIILFLAILPKVFGIDGVWLTLPLAEIMTVILSVVCFKSCRDAISYSIKKKRLMVK